MKLLNYSSTRFSVILLLLLSIWAVLFYFQINDEIYDSLDEGLENQKDLLIQKVKQNGSIANGNSLEDGYSNIKPISKAEARGFEESVKDTLLYIDEEYEPVRLLVDVFEYEGTPYKISVSTSMVEEGDLIQGMLWSLLWLYLGLIISILVLNNLLLRKVWNPFYTLLSRLRNFSIEKDEQIAFEPTKIEEFSLLNKQIEQLLQKSVESYRGQKQFIENASHELQTPLAISINKLELLVENHELPEEQLLIVASVLSNLERLTRLNRSLLLLSKIENRQFLELEPVNFNELTAKVVEDFEDLAAHRKLDISVKELGQLVYDINPDLARILVSNLMKNAVIHSPKSGKIEIELGNRSLRFTNASEGTALKQETLFSRFKQVGNEGRSTGLGLAISKAIANRFGLQLDYSHNDAHRFEIRFPAP